MEPDSAERVKHPTTANKGDLDSSVKLSISYLSIVAGLGCLGLAFYVIAAQGSTVSPYPAQDYVLTIAFFSGIITISVIGALLLKRGEKIGAYFAFAVLVLSVLAPYGPRGGFPLSPVYWIAIPNAVVGTLLAMRFKTLT